MTATQEQHAPGEARPREVRIVSHSMLFYWWPVWVVGFLLAGLTWWDGHRLAIVPPGTQVVEGFEGGREALVLPAEAHLPQEPATGRRREPTLCVASHSGCRYGQQAQKSLSRMQLPPSRRTEERRWPTIGNHEDTDLEPPCAKPVKPCAAKPQS